MFILLSLLTPPALAAPCATPQALVDELAGALDALADAPGESVSASFSVGGDAKLGDVATNASIGAGIEGALVLERGEGGALKVGLQSSGALSGGGDLGTVLQGGLAEALESEVGVAFDSSRDAAAWAVGLAPGVEVEGEYGGPELVLGGGLLFGGVGESELGPAEAEVGLLGGLSGDLDGGGLVGRGGLHVEFPSALGEVEVDLREALSEAEGGGVQREYALEIELPEGELSGPAREEAAIAIFAELESRLPEAVWARFGPDLFELVVDNLAAEPGADGPRVEGLIFEWSELERGGVVQESPWQAFVRRGVDLNPELEARVAELELELSLEQVERVSP